MVLLQKVFGIIARELTLYIFVKYKKSKKNFKKSSFSFRSL